MLDDGLPRLTCAPRFSDEIEVRLQFALKWFSPHTLGRDDNPFSLISSCYQFAAWQPAPALKSGNN